MPLAASSRRFRAVLGKGERGMGKKASGIVALVFFGCAGMALVETVLEPVYGVKSALKTVLFLLLPLAYLKAEGEAGLRKLLIPTRKGFGRGLLLGGTIYVLILGAFWLTKGVFDYAAIIEALEKDQGVSRESFVWVAAYISFGNSLLEEFFFRGFAFLKLRGSVERQAAYAFSACLFAGYHVFMIAASFPLPLLLLAVLGLAAGGMIFCRLDEKDGNLYNSWMVHVFADLALMTIWLGALTA